MQHQPRPICPTQPDSVVIIDLLDFYPNPSMDGFESKSAKLSVLRAKIDRRGCASVDKARSVRAKVCRQLRFARPCFKAKKERFHRSKQPLTSKGIYHWPGRRICCWRQPRTIDARFRERQPHGLSSRLRRLANTPPRLGLSSLKPGRPPRFLPFLNILWVDTNLIHL